MIKISVCLILLFGIVALAATSSSEPGVAVNWGAFTNPVLDENGDILGEKCLLQLIWDADGDGIDEPGENGAVCGGDRLLDISYTRAGSFFPGMFSQNVTCPGLKTGDRVFVRAWNAHDVGIATHYGDTRHSRTSMWPVRNGVSLSLDATRHESWGTDRLWSPQGVLLWRVEEKYSARVLHSSPNPCKGSARIRFTVPGKRVSGVSDDGSSMITHAAGSDKALVNISVYDASGRLVRVVLQEERLPGLHVVNWDGRDGAGQAVPSGSYFLSLSTRGRDGRRSSLTRKMVVVK